MQAGWLRHRVIIQQKTVTRSVSGAEIVAWQDYKSAWASIEPLKGQEYLAGKAQEAEIDVRIRLRYQDGITPAMRVLFGSRVFEIVSVINSLERDTELQLMARELL